MCIRDRHALLIGTSRTVVAVPMDMGGAVGAVAVRARCAVLTTVIAARGTLVTVAVGASRTVVAVAVGARCAVLTTVIAARGTLVTGTIGTGGTVIAGPTGARRAVVKTARRLPLLSAVSLLGASPGFGLLGRGPASLLGRAGTDAVVHLDIHLS